MSYGVYVVTALDQRRPVGCIANSIMQITSSPATVAVSINHDNYTNGCIAKDGRFAFSILSESSDPSIIGTFGFQSSKNTDKFSNIPFIQKLGLPVIPDSCGYVICNVINTLETETHTIFLGEVVDADVFHTTAPAMTYAYYHNVIKGKSPKNAPTYVEVTNNDNTYDKYECIICGHIYDESIELVKFEDLPDNWVCPTCGVGKDKFKKIN